MNWIASGGAPAFSSALASTAAISALDSIASLPPRRRTALPDFTQSAGGVRGDVGARLVDEADDAEGHAHARDLEAVGPAPRLHRLAHGIGQGRDLAQARRHLLDAVPRSG